MDVVKRLSTPRKKKRKFIQGVLSKPGAKGGLHRSTNTPQGQKIPASKMAAALRGDYGPKAQKQARFARTLRGFH